ncbi:MAG TPA: hypothetical protein VHM65_11125, partial [Candidatus Lustribacter sp.]|nr:hypothetical protein [Candidatus Lustribacter sp.]
WAQSTRELTCPAVDLQAECTVLLTLTTTAPPDSPSPVTDLGYPLHKHPARVQPLPVTAGTAHFFCPEATAERCTAALVLHIDPIALVGRRTFRDSDRQPLG